MTDYSRVSLEDARRDYLATSTTAMPIAGLIAWAALAVAAYAYGPRLPFSRRSSQPPYRSRSRRILAMKKPSSVR